MRIQQKSVAEAPRSFDSLGKVPKNQKFSSQKVVTVDTDSNFSLEHDELLDSINEFCQEIQVKGYANVKSTCEILKRYKILKQFKISIDQYWVQIQKSMRRFLEADKQIMKTYSELKNRALQCQQKIMGSENVGQLGQLIRILEDSLKLKLEPKKIKMPKNEQNYLDGQFKNWKSSKVEIEQFENIIKEYALKLMEVVMQKNDTYSYDDDEETKRENSQNYFMLRSKISSEINAKVLSEKPVLMESNLKINLPTVSIVKSIKSKTKRSNVENYQKQRYKQKKQDAIIDKILDLYKYN